MDVLVVAIGVFGSLAWLGMSLQGLWVTLRVPLLSEQRPPIPDGWPPVAIVLAARDEGRTIGPALRSVLALDYPALEVVAVDDRSRDDTGAIIDRLAAEDPRLTTLHVTDLPDGWLGKTHALARGAERADASYLLFTDADVHFSPDLLRRTIAIAEDQELDHLTLVPRFVASGPLIGAWMAAFTDGYAARGRGRRTIVHPTDGPAFGYGAFNLVRRTTLAASEGFEWLRLDVLDDLALGVVLQRAGARRGFLVADEGVEVEWYSSLREALRTIEKNGFGALASYRLWRAVAFAVTILVVLVGGPIAALVQDRLPLWPVLAAAAAALVAFQLAATVRLRRPLVHGLLTPLAVVAMGPAVLRAAIVTLRLGGVRWRDTIYPLDELREGQRVTFP